ncbi:MAG: hypothetical protein ACLQOO_16070 [Terriglobia bacterium]
MNSQWPVWMPTVLSLLATLIVVVFTAWLNTRALSAQMESLRRELDAKMESLRRELDAKIELMRAEMKQGFADLRLEFHTQISDLAHRVERLEERPGSVQRP